MSYLKSVLLLGTALSLAACGADDVASPGEGTIITPPTAGGGGTNPGGGTTPPPTGSAAADCPAGTTDVGIIQNRTGTTVNASYRQCRLPRTIATNLTLPYRAGTVYSFSGRVDVGVDIGGPGTAVGGQRVDLTVQAGAIVYAESGASPGYIVVNRGSRLFASGTATRPIIFTSQNNVEGTATDTTQGQWGGIILAGRAPISNCNATGIAGGSAGCENTVEATSPAVLYGGAVPTDDSGTIRYVQIRNTGTVLSEGIELQGLTTAGAGSSTTIEYLQSHNSQDDGIEVFGGRQNMRYLVITGADDDTFDTDVGYKGSVQFVLGIQRSDITFNDARMIEADSNGNEDALPRQNTRLANFTFVHRSTPNQAAILLRGGTDYTLVNGIVTSPSACLDIDSEAKATTQVANATLDEVGPPIFRSVVFACASDFVVDTGANSGTYTRDDIVAVFNPAGVTTNNVLANGAQTTVLTGGTGNQASFQRAGAASTAVASNPATFNATGSTFLVATDYVGAVRDANDTWYAGWSCSSSLTANFGTTSGACTSLPAFQAN